MDRVTIWDAIRLVVAFLVGCFVMLLMIWKDMD